MRWRAARGLGMLVLAIWLILTGLLALLDRSIPGRTLFFRCWPWLLVSSFSSNAKQLACLEE